MPRTGLKQQTLISSQRWRPEVQGQVQAGLVSPGASLLGMYVALFSLSPHLAVPLCVCVLTSSY